MGFIVSLILPDPVLVFRISWKLLMCSLLIYCMSHYSGCSFCKGRNIGIRRALLLSPKYLGQCTISLILRLKRSLTTIRWEYLLLHFTGLLWLSDEWCIWCCNLRTHKVHFVHAKVIRSTRPNPQCLVMDTRTLDISHA